MAILETQLYEQALVIRSQLGDEAAFGELLTLQNRLKQDGRRRVIHPEPPRIRCATIAVLTPNLAPSGLKTLWPDHLGRCPRLSHHRPFGAEETAL